MPVARPNEMLSMTVYVTEARGSVVSALSAVASELAAGTKDAKLVTTFADKQYHRSSFVFGARPERMPELAVAFASAVLCSPARGGYAARPPDAHPTLGLIDHVCLQPLLDTPLDRAAAAAEATASALGAQCRLPCVVYGSTRRTLADIRRSAGAYFSLGGDGDGRLLTPDYGPVVGMGEDGAEPAGLCCVGSAAHVLNYNVQVELVGGVEGGASLAAFGTAVKRLARAVSTRGGGPPHVEAMGLPYGVGTASDGGGRVVWEVGCNLLDPDVTTPDAVLAALRALVEAHNGGEGAQQGVHQVRIALGRAYTIGLSKRDVGAVMAAHVGGGRATVSMPE